MASETDAASVHSMKEDPATEYTGNEEYEGAIEEEHEETESEGEVYTPLSSNEDPEKQQAYKEYRRLERSIKCQNKTLEDFKVEIQTFSRKPCLTQSEQKHLKNLKHNYEQELHKLRFLSTKAVNLQNFGSRMHYRGFPLFNGEAQHEQ